MADLVRILETYCDNNDIVYRYGSKSHLNLLESQQAISEMEQKTHLLLFPVRRGTFNRNDNSRITNGWFFFVLPDNFDRHYFNERNQPIEDSKFALKIEPLMQQLKSLELYLNSCVGLDVINMETVEAIDVLDVNLTGFYVTYQFKVYE